LLEVYNSFETSNFSQKNINEKIKITGKDLNHLVDYHCLAIFGIIVIFTSLSQMIQIEWKVNLANIYAKNGEMVGENTGCKPFWKITKKYTKLFIQKIHKCRIL
jgi:hypothetical protein